MRRSPKFKAYSALVAVYFFWGTTYIAIRMALESFPPLVLVSGRYLLSGGILVIATMLKGGKFPVGRELVLTALFGILMLGGGNGALVFSEVWIPSSIAALFVTTSPFWMVGLEAVLPGGDRPHLPTILGILVGFFGVLLLFAPAVAGSLVDTNLIRGFLVLQVGGFSWSLGAILHRRSSTTAHPVVSGAVQQLATGLALLPFALAVKHPPIQWSDRGNLALAWLVIFGSIVGYSAFVYVMETLPVSVASTYVYVNTVVAVFLGWLFYREPFGMRETIAMLAVFAGVAIVKYYAIKAPIKSKSVAA